MAERAGGVRGDAALPFKLRDHSLFQGFAPANNPRYAASCILEHSGHMATAAPIVSDVLTFLYDQDKAMRSEEHTSELQSLMRISYAVFCLQKTTHTNTEFYVS